jgi:hypothetical protein
MKFDKIKNEDLDNLDLLPLADMIKSDEYKRYFLSSSGMEHYRLLSFISQTNNNIQILDIGTLKGCSALAFSINKSNNVISIDIASQVDLYGVPENVKFIIDNILSEKYVDTILNSKYILLDTFHDGTFEKEFHQHLIDIKYYGVVIFDDIKLNPQMIEFWNSISNNKLELTSIGHVTGTGVVFYF